jgi:hypothetical protein
MPVQAALKFEEYDSLFVIETIMPGRQIALPNYEEGEEEILIVRCLEDDFGGELYALGPSVLEPGVDEHGPGMLVPIEQLNDETLTAEFNFGETYEQEVEDRRGTKATLILSHIGQCAVHQRLN